MRMTMRYQISEVEKLFPNWHNKSSDLSYDDQKWIWENVPLPEEDELKLKQLNASERENVCVSESVNGVRRFRANSELNWHEFTAVSELSRCNSHTSPKELASFLEEIFRHWESKEGHWLWITQRYTARTINCVMIATIKEFKRSGIRKTPPAYFTYVIRHRKKRKQLRLGNKAMTS